MVVYLLVDLVTLVFATIILHHEPQIVEGKKRSSATELGQKVLKIGI